MESKSNVTSMPTVPAAPNTRYALAVIFFILLIDIVGLTILFPVAPFIVQRYSNDAIMVTLLSGIYAAAQFVAAPALGKISDRVGRRPVLLVCLIGSAIGYFVFGIGGSLWVLFLARLVDGITGGNLSTASAYIADVSTPETRAKNFGLIGMAFGLGFIIGPALGGAASQLSIDAPAYLAGLLSIASVALIYFFLPESLPKAKRETAPLRAQDFDPFRSISAMARKPGLGLLFIVTCLFAFTFNGVTSTMGVYLAKQLSALPWHIALLFVVGGLITALTQMLLVQRVVKRFGEKTMAMVSLISLCLGTLSIVLAPTVWWVYPTALLRNGLGVFIWSTLGSLTASRVQPYEQGRLAGVNTALQSLMGVFGPLAAGAAYDSISAGAPFWLGAAIYIVAAWVVSGDKANSTHTNTGAHQAAHH